MSQVLSYIDSGHASTCPTRSGATETTYRQNHDGRSQRGNALRMAPFSDHSRQTPRAPHSASRAGIQGLRARPLVHGAQWQVRLPTAAQRRRPVTSGVSCRSCSFEQSKTRICVSSASTSHLLPPTIVVGHTDSSYPRIPCRGLFLCSSRSILLPMTANPIAGTMKLLLLGTGCWHASPPGAPIMTGGGIAERYGRSTP